MRVYVYTRAFYDPNTLPPIGVWHISVFRLDGSLLWRRDIYPSPSGVPEGKQADPDDFGWSIVVGRSAVGDLLGHGKRNDVIRVARTRFFAGARWTRYSFLDLLTGELIKDIQYLGPRRPPLEP